MNTTDLIERVAAEHGVAKEHTKKIVDSALAAIAAAASAGEEVTLAGFGRFKVTDRAERQGRNPATGEPITIAASVALPLMPGPGIRQNNGLQLPLTPDRLANPGISLPALP